MGLLTLENLDVIAELRSYGSEPRVKISMKFKKNGKCYIDGIVKKDYSSFDKAVTSGNNFNIFCDQSYFREPIQNIH